MLRQKGTSGNASLWQVSGRGGGRPVSHANATLGLSGARVSKAQNGRQGTHYLAVAGVQRASQEGVEQNDDRPRRDGGGTTRPA